MKKLSITVSISALLLSSQLVHADGIYMSNMQTVLTDASIIQLTGASRTEGVVAGDIVEYVLSADVVGQTKNAGDAPKDEAGPGTYFTAYIPSGIEVLGASIVTDVSGLSSKDPNTAGLAANGWMGAELTYKSPYDITDANGGQNNGRMNDIYGDTGIFYSEDLDTKLKLELGDTTNIAKGPIGFPKDSAPTSNGIPVTVSSWGNVDAFNQWDKDQADAFGSAGGFVSEGRGPTPYEYGSTVAGPQTGYKYEYNGSTLNSEGPWKRIQYSGSTISNIGDGPAVDSGTTGTKPFVSSDFTADVTVVPSLGRFLSDSNPLPSTTNAIRWSTGEGDDNAPVGPKIFVKVRVRVTQAAIDATDGVVLNFTANGSDSIPGGSKDNHWRYFAPTTATVTGAFSFEKKILKVNDVNYPGGNIASGSKITYQIRYLNLGNLPIKNVVITDLLPNSVREAGCTAGLPSLSSTDVTVSSPCPTSSSTVTFTDLNNVNTAGNLGALRGGTFTYDLRLKNGISNGVEIKNTASIQGKDAVSGNDVSKSASTSVNIGAPPVLADLSVIKTLDSTGPFTTGLLVDYSIVVSNAATPANTATNIVVTDLPTNLLVTSAIGDATTTCTIDPLPVTLMDTDSVICNITTLAAGSSKTIAIQAKVP